MSRRAPEDLSKDLFATRQPLTKLWFTMKDRYLTYLLATCAAKVRQNNAVYLSRRRLAKKCCRRQGVAADEEISASRCETLKAGGILKNYPASHKAFILMHRSITVWVRHSGRVLHHIGMEVDRSCCRVIYVKLCSENRRARGTSVERVTFNRVQLPR
jgi:hypothetical protein